MNRCYICDAEAVSRCYTCGQLICAQHGDDDCHRCNTGVAAGDPRSTHISTHALRPNDANRGWWRPQLAEEYEPPACYECKGLARAVCRNCESHYCRDHAGPGALCLQCARSARMGLVIFVIALGMMFALVLLGLLFNY
jgi:hypothetical protein